MSIEFTRRVVITTNLGTATNSTAGVAGDVVDMTGFEGACAFVISSATGTGANSGITCQIGTSSGSLSETTGRVVPTKRGLYMDIYRPNGRFLKFVALATASGAVRSLITMQYNAETIPVTQPASTTGTRYYSPGTGTATG